MKKPVIIIGSGGHAKVLVDILKLRQIRIIGVVDPQPKQILSDIPLLGSDKEVDQFSPEAVQLVNGIGSIQSLASRKEVFQRFKRKGYSFATLIHPSAIIASDVRCAEGIQIMAGAVIQTGSYIGENTMINTRASVDHDCQIGAHVHLASGATLCGHVKVGEETHIGAGSTVIQHIHIGSQCLVGAGAVVIRNINHKTTVIGVPAKELRS